MLIDSEPYIWHVKEKYGLLAFVTCPRHGGSFHAHPNLHDSGTQTLDSGLSVDVSSASTMDISSPVEGAQTSSISIFEIINSDSDMDTHSCLLYTSPSPRD